MHFTFSLSLSRYLFWLSSSALCSISIARLHHRNYGFYFIISDNAHEMMSSKCCWEKEKEREKAKESCSEKNNNSKNTKEWKKICWGWHFFFGSFDSYASFLIYSFPFHPLCFTSRAYSKNYGTGGEYHF